MSTARGAVSPTEGLILCFRVSEVVMGNAVGTEAQNLGSAHYRRMQVSPRVTPTGLLQVVSQGSLVDS